MNITYEFVTGERLEIEVSEAVGNLSIEIDRGIYNSDRKETRRHNSIENMQSCGFQFQDTAPECNIEDYMEKAELTYEVREAIRTLLPCQQELIKKVFFKKMKLTHIAKEEKVTEAAIRNRLKKIYRKL